MPLFRFRLTRHPRFPFWKIRDCQPAALGILCVPAYSNDSFPAFSTACFSPTPSPPFPSFRPLPPSVTVVEAGISRFAHYAETRVRDAKVCKFAILAICVGRGEGMWMMQNDCSLTSLGRLVPRVIWRGWLLFGTAWILRGLA